MGCIVSIIDALFVSVSFAGDLFECEADIKDGNIWRQLSEQPELQEQNRRRVLELADYIVPGHGAMFKVDKGAS